MRRAAAAGRCTGARRALESFLADTHGRDSMLEGELALDADGRFLALRVRTAVGMGAYASTYSAIVATNNTKNCLSTVYRIPAIHVGVTDGSSPTPRRSGPIVAPAGRRRSTWSSG